ncbi:MAG: YdcF family protein [Alphaproteobacteria bacterium]|nr:YdcF family protein [Alphaproteobacteria bacterium]
MVMSKVAIRMSVVLLGVFLAGVQQFAHEIIKAGNSNPTIQDLTMATSQQTGLGNSSSVRRGIVVATGSGGRIEAGTTLMLNDLAQRMLISGTGSGVSLDDIRLLAHTKETDSSGIDKLFQCCVDLGPEALDTRGNAIETRNWARSRDLGEILLVTSDFHIPRALIEFRRAMPDVKVLPYAVRTTGLGVDQNGLTMWWRNPSRIITVCREYGKYLASLIT